MHSKISIVLGKLVSKYVSKKRFKCPKMTTVTAQAPQKLR